MWKLKRDEVIKLAVEKLLDVFQAFERKDDTLEPPPKPEPPPRVLRQSEQPGIDMNDMLRGIPKPRPPRRPGMQTRRWNGYYWHY